MRDILAETFMLLGAGDTYRRKDFLVALDIEDTKRARKLWKALRDNGRIGTAHSRRFRTRSFWLSRALQRNAA